MNSAPVSIQRSFLPALITPRSAGRRLLLALLLLSLKGASASTEGTAFTRHAPLVNSGRIEGALHMMLAESLTLHGKAAITGDLLVPGTPSVTLNGHPSLGGTVACSGSATPSGWQISLSGNARIGSLRTRTDPIVLPTVAAPETPLGSRSVTISAPGHSAGDWNTLRDLTLNPGTGQYAVPPGVYRNFTAHGGSGFTLGIAGATAPAVYSLQSLALHGQSTLQVAGPVILTIGTELTMNSPSGSAAHPEWLEIRLSAGGLTLNGGSALHARVLAPNGTVTVHGHATLTGALTSNRLVLNGNALLRLCGDTPTFNQPPVAQPQSLDTAEDTPLLLTLTAQDPDSSALAYTLLSAPQHGTLSGAVPDLTYTPHPDYHGPDHFTFTAGDGTLTSAPAAITLTVTPVNDAPVAAGQSMALTEDHSAALTLSADDPEGDPITYTILTYPEYGTLSGTPPHLTYIPATDYWGSDSLSFIANDGTLDSAPAAITLHIAPVSDIPTATPLEAALDEDAAIDITLTGTDGDGDPLTFATLTPPAHGTLWLLGNVATYIPHPHYHGPDTFTYTVSDGLHLSAPAPVTLTIHPVNDPPAVASGIVTLPEDTTATLTFSFHDPDADPLTWEILTLPLHGALTGTGPDYTYTPEPHYHGPDHFTVRVTDPSGATADGGAAITVTPVNDPPVADTLTVSTLEEQPVPVDLTATDPDGDPLTFTLLTPTQSGQLTGEAPHLLYTPDPEFFGQDTLLFSVTDGQETHIATVFIATAPVNDPPLAEPGTLTTLEDTPATLQLSALATDIDDPPAALTFSILTPPQHGTLTGSGSTLTFTPTANWHGTDTLTWRVTDSGGLTADSNVTISVAPVNDPPSVAGETHAAITLPAFAALTATNGLQVMRPLRDNLWDREIRPLLVAYRAKILGEYPPEHPFVESLPNIYPAPGSTPDPVNLTGTFNETTNQAEYAWSASTDPALDRYEVRQSPGSSYDSDASSVIATVPPAGPLTLNTGTGFETPGQTSSVKAYVVLTTGNERGSNTVTLTRPV